MIIYIQQVFGSVHQQLGVFIFKVWLTIDTD